jgi:hypothetical protein
MLLVLVFGVHLKTPFHLSRRDSLYPGLLSVNQEDVATFAASAQRLADFVSEHLVAHVLSAPTLSRRICRIPITDVARSISRTKLRWN